MEGKELVSALRALGMSQREIGERCGLSQGAISHIETGRRKNLFAATERSLEALYREKLAEDAGSSTPEPAAQGAA
ncbi:helix-turn-helix domain-containing protein [Burkholderia gladioli]|uniref:helix-turn-helix domain-containing protein n=1 Tax=Burkholderia gladioli TaxID=28095 RepID=UPI001640B0A5|nr:helix-turn-helix domain-containing protein [Burkholderia gladioli]